MCSSARRQDSPRRPGGHGRATRREGLPGWGRWRLHTARGYRSAQHVLCPQKRLEDRSARPAKQAQTVSDAAGPAHGLLEAFPS